MKQLFTQVLLAGALLGAGCNKIKDAATFSFDVPYETSISMSGIPGQPVTDSLLPFPQPQTISLPVVALATNSDATFSQYNTASDKIISAKLSQLTLAVTQPPGGNLDFLNDVRVYMAAQGVSETLVAEKAPVPKGAAKVDLDVRDTDLKPLLQRDTIYLRVAATFNALPASRTQLQLSSKFKLTANPLR